MDAESDCEDGVASEETEKVAIVEACVVPSLEFEKEEVGACAQAQSKPVTPRKKRPFLFISSLQ